MAVSDELRKLVDPNNECCCENCLSNKCKEWAWKMGFGINITRSLLHDMYSTTIFYKNGAFASSGGLEETEPEAIFRACEWVLKEK